MILLMTKAWSVFNIIFFGVFISLMTFINYPKVLQYCFYTLDTNEAICEFFATYGGAMFAFAAMFLFLHYQGRFQELMYCISLVYLSFGAARLFAYLQYPPTNPMVAYFLIFEIVGGIFSLFLAQKLSV